MTDTAVEPATTEVEHWLSRFEQALTAGDSAAAAELFLDDSFWRDLVAFTWNLKTRRGAGGRQGHARPHARAHEAAQLGHDGAARERRGRDRGVDRVRDRGGPRPRPPAAQGRQGVDAADHARRAHGHEESAGPGRRWAPSTAPTRSARRGRAGAPRARCRPGRPADLIVYATGYGSMNGWAADLISQEVADKVGKVWGLGSDTAKDPGPWEGEQRNMWKPTQQEALWFHGGNLAPVAPLLALARAPAQGADRGHRHAGLRPTGGPPAQLSAARTTGTTSVAKRSVWPSWSS